MRYLISLMKVLLTNDDGIHAPGIITLADELRRMEPSVPGLELNYEVVAPADECSAVGHSISLRRPIEVRRVDITTPGGAEFAAYAIDGTPADCVKFAATTLFPNASIGMVLSGINRGPNVGINIFYSGTVAAIIEAAIQGIPGVAVSVGFSDGRGDPKYNRAARMTAQLVETLVNTKALPAVPVWNINFPDENKPIKGVVLTHQSTGGFKEKYRVHDKHRSWPRTYTVTGKYLLPKKDKFADSHALHDGYVSVTPLGLDLTYTKPSVLGHRKQPSPLPPTVLDAIDAASRMWDVPFIT